MPIPIYLDGEKCGTLTETREGLYRVFRADCPPREGLRRLWLHGEGRSVYLGLLTPEGGRLRLCRRFSRAAALPERIDCARDSCVPQPKGRREELLWPALPDGTLAASDGEFRYRAFPAALSPASPAAARLRRIGGKDYLVFRLRA